ncbi:putative IRON-SULFUR-BINDING REDUCTASE domain protein [Mycobacterium xenopi 3993]|nr:putative IRON-SULFUR-BINDING REDUCTASE domain protein [Mycobacterium xenopi 3993]
MVVRDLRCLRRTVPVDIEHVDHIVDLRRYQVMMESEFPSELSVLFKTLRPKRIRGPERVRPHQLDRRGRLRRAGVRPRRRQLRRVRVPVLGRLCGGLRRQGQEDHQGGR